MANELILTYAKTGATVTAKAFYNNAGTMTQRTGIASLTEDVAGIYGGDAADITGLTAGDTVVYYDGSVIVGSETYGLVSQIQSGLALSTEIAALQSHGDSTWPTATGFAVPGSQMALTTATITSVKDGLSTHSASDAATAVLNSTGITAGGTWTLRKILKVMAAWAVGKWENGDDAGTYKIRDAESVGTTVMIVTPSSSSPQKVTAVL